MTLLIKGPWAEELFDDVFVAARAGCVKSIRKKISEGVSPDSRDSSGASLLMLAAWHGRAMLVNALLNDGANPRSRNAVNRTTIHYAAKCHKSLSHLLLTPAALDVSSPDSKGFTPLMLSCIMGVGQKGAQPGKPEDRLPCVKALLDAGAWPDAMNEDGMTALMFAARSGSKELVELLIKSGARRDIVCKSGKRAVDYAKPATREILSMPMFKLV